TRPTLSFRSIAANASATPQAPPSDTTPPTVSLTAPANGSTVSGSAVTVSANASDNVGVAGVQFLLDGVNLGSEDTSSPYSITWNTSSTSNGSHILTARARDAAGNQTISSGVTVTVNNTTSVKFAINDRVQVFGTGGTGLNVRSCASITCSLQGTQPDNALGTVIGGPTYADGFQWWNVDYDTGADGWGVEDFLQKYTSPPSGSADFQTRCSQPGVVKCVGFDQASDIAGVYGDNQGIFPGEGTTKPTLDTNMKASGNSALLFTILSNTGAAGAGAYFTNFSPDLSVQFGENSEFYVQWRQRFSKEFLNTFFSSGAGALGSVWKQDIISAGDKPGCTHSTSGSGLCTQSCTQLEVVANNVGSYLTPGFSIIYHSCGGKDGRYEPLTYYDSALNDIILQNGVDCRYNNAHPTIPPCMGYKADQWMTFQVHIKIGTWYKNDGV
ncbi:MAG: Ig-like domain-containing protein, partial [Patescibacteria group bacterium]